MNYPLGQFEKETITSKSGKHLSDITLQEVKNGNITSEDIKISRETLHKQAQVCVEHDNPAMAANLSRAAELVDVPDDIILKMYNQLRPNRSAKKDLLDMAHELQDKYHAPLCAKMVLEAADIYEKRGILL
jgi:propanediol dehydratase small subunit